MRCRIPEIGARERLHLRPGDTIDEKRRLRWRLRGKKEVRATACPGSPFLEILGIEAVCDCVSQGRTIGLRQINQLRRSHLFCCGGSNNEAKQERIFPHSATTIPPSAIRGNG